MFSMFKTMGNEDNLSSRCSNRPRGGMCVTEVREHRLQYSRCKRRAWMKVYTRAKYYYHHHVYWLSTRIAMENCGMVE